MIEFVEDFELDEPTKLKPFIRVGNDGSFNLKVEDEAGHSWFLLTIHRDGTFEREIDIPKSLGFLLDNKGRIMEKPF